MPGHFSGRLTAAIERANKATRGRDGAFYSILNDRGFYDIDDENNGLTPEQRAGVPEYNQRRMSALCDAISDMIADFLQNDDYGVLTTTMEQIVDKLDQRSTMNKASMDTVTGILAAIPGGQAVKGATMTMEQVIAAVMGGNPFDPDLIPPIALGFPGLPIDIASCFRPGYFNADWTFLYDHELHKSKKVYFGADGSPCIGAGIPLTVGGNANVLILKMIFSVPTVNKDGTPEGDVANGITAEQFDILMKASKMTSQAEVDKDPDVSGFELTDGQMRASYFKYIQMSLWGVLSNKNNWAYLHWGCLTNNACPEAIKTAVCSFLKTNGLALNPDTSQEACLISYLVNAGMNYYIGATRRLALIDIDGTELLDGKTKVVHKKGSYNWIECPDGVPRNTKLANKYFAMVADVLARLTYGSNPHALELRKRRVDEANKIYDYLGMGTITFGKVVSGKDLTKDAVESRGFFKLLKSNDPFKVYANESVKVPADPGDVDIHVACKSEVPLTDTSLATLRYLCRVAGIPGLVVTSIYRSPEKQASTMLENRLKANGGRPVTYAAPGRGVDDKYDEVYKKYHGGPAIGKLTNKKEVDEALRCMTDQVTKCMNEGKFVSRHVSDGAIMQAIDIGPNSTKVRFKCSSESLMRLHSACMDAKKSNYLRTFLAPKAEFGGPGDDPAFHIEVWCDDSHPHVPDDGTGGVMPLPTVDVKVTNTNLLNKETFDSVFTGDQVLAAQG